jgi:glycosyltransferase involved in cell wall biosynthesis
VDLAGKTRIVCLKRIKAKVLLLLLVFSGSVLFDLNQIAFIKMKIQKLSIIIPAFNEGNTIHLILNKIKAVNLIEDIQKEIIIVNDHSTDHTEQAIADYQKDNPGLDINYFKHEFNKGKGASLHTGISKATGEYLIIQDADL